LVLSLSVSVTCRAAKELSFVSVPAIPTLFSMFSPGDVKTWQDVLKLLQDANPSDRAMLQLNRLCNSLTKGFTFSKVTHKRLLAKEVREDVCQGGRVVTGILS
jgi:hypothetical protein